VDVKAFLLCVEDLGGRNEVTSARQWREIARRVGIDTVAARYASTSLKRMHVLLETAACKAAGGSLHWHRGEGGGALVLQPFLDLLASRGAAQCKKKRGSAAKENAASISACELRKEALALKGESIMRECSEEAGVQYLVDEVGIKASQIGRILSLYPQLRHLSVPNNLRPTVQFLMQEGHVPSDKLAKVCTYAAQIYTPLLCFSHAHTYINLEQSDGRSFIHTHTHTQTHAHTHTHAHIDLEQCGGRSFVNTHIHTYTVDIFLIYDYTCTKCSYIRPLVSIDTYQYVPCLCPSRLSPCVRPAKHHGATAKETDSFTWNIRVSQHSLRYKIIPTCDFHVSMSE
jgi:hypothetical protein